MGFFHQDIEVETLPQGASIFDNQLHGYNGSFIKEVKLKRILLEGYLFSTRLVVAQPAVPQPSRRFVAPPSCPLVMPAGF